MKKIILLSIVTLSLLKGFAQKHVGIGTTNPLAALHVADSSVLFTGPATLPVTATPPPVSGAGNRMFWYADNAAFRAGGVGSTQWDKINVGQYSFAVGLDSKASQFATTALGNNCLASANYATAMGRNTISSGAVSTAMGFNTNATGAASTAIGSTTNAVGINSFAAGTNTIALGNYSFAAGDFTNAVGNYSFGLGHYARANGDKSFALGDSVRAEGYASTAMGFQSIASGNFSTAMGTQNNATGHYSTAAGFNTKANGEKSFALGDSVIANGYASTAMGFQTTASGKFSTAMGNLTTASGGPSTAMGFRSGANGSGSTAMGFISVANGTGSTAIGNQTSASGFGASAIGFEATATCDYCTAIGTNTIASGNNSTAMGINASTNSRYQSFCIGGSNSVPTLNTTDNQMMMRFDNYTFWVSPANFAYLIPASNGWAYTSDKNKKEKFEELNGETVLNKISAIPFYSWNFKDPTCRQYRHYGIMAQDFYNAFGKDSYGNIGNDTTVSPLDMLGVDMAAIKALEKRSQLLSKENETMKTTITQLQDKLVLIESKLNELLEVKQITAK